MRVHFTLFYFKFMSGNRNRHSGEWLSQCASQARRTWNGLAFERVCLEHADQLKSTHLAEKAKELFGPYWKRVESGELLYMPVVQFCWGQDSHAAEILPTYLALEPRAAAMYECCFKDEAGLKNLAAVRAAPGRPRIWINTMWDTLAAGYGEADRALPKGKTGRLSTTTSRA